VRWPNAGKKDTPALREKVFQDLHKKGPIQEKTKGKKKEKPKNVSDQKQVSRGDELNDASPGNGSKEKSGICARK